MSVLIVGGGMTGATLALAISRLTGGALPVHLIEAQDPHSSRHPGFDDRAIALAAGTCQQLARIGIWQTLAKRATPIQRVHVSDRGHAGFVNLAAADYGLSALGQVVELHDVGQRLFSLLREAPGADLRTTAFLQPAQAFLDRIGLWDRLAPHASPLRVMRIVDAGGALPEARTIRDFDAAEIDKALADYAARDRRYGGVKTDISASGQKITLAPDA